MKFQYSMKLFIWTVKVIETWRGQLMLSVDRGRSTSAENAQRMRPFFAAFDGRDSPLAFVSLFSTLLSPFVHGSI
jgi:hypothetical protein